MHSSMELYIPEYRAYFLLNFHCLNKNVILNVIIIDSTFHAQIP